MEMIKVKSSNVIAIGWDNNALYVQYPSGTYIYAGVPKQVFDDMLKAESKGRFMHECVQPKYSAIKVVKKQDK